MESLLPAVAARKGRCQRCHRPAARLIQGFGEECADQLGLTPRTPRLHRHEQHGPDLFTDPDEEDHCDGWDR